MAISHVVIVGGGFAGLEAAKTLARVPVEVTLIDRQNHHCFQPLLYQVATATLSPADVAWPIRSILSGQRNLRVVMANVEGIDLGRHVVHSSGGEFPYDELIIATGAAHAYFGHEDWAPHAPGLKRIEDATEIRRSLLTAFERAELETDPRRQRALTTFVVVGGGPTGVEMAGAIADMAHEALPRDFRNVDPDKSRVILLEAGPRVLAAFPEASSSYARRALERRGVEVRTGTAVTSIEAGRVVAGGSTFECGAAIWAAGVAASAAADWLQAERDRAGRVKVTQHLTVPGRPEIFVIGDTASVLNRDGKPVPGIAPAAKQMGRYVGSVIAARVSAAPLPGAFHYRHQGDLATIGRRAAVVRLRRITMKGFIGWAFWGVVHVYFLIGLRNRIAVAFSWVWDYVTFGRRARLITEPAGAPPAEVLPGGSALPPSATEPTKNAGTNSSDKAPGWR